MIRIIRPKFSLLTFNRTEPEDPLKVALFRIEIDGFVRAGFMEGSAPKFSMSENEYREGGDAMFARKSPSGVAKVENIELKRGKLVAGPGAGQDDFLAWVNQVVDLASGKGSISFRKNIDYVLLNRQLKEVSRYRLYEAWPSAYVPFGDLKALGNEDSMESLTITFERFHKV